MADKLVQFKGTIYEEGYGFVAKKVMKDKNISVGARCLYAYLCTYVDSKSGSTNSFPGREKICYELKINKNTFTKYKNELTENGYIVITQNRKNKKYGNNIYSIESIQQCPKKQDTEKQDTEKQDTEKVDSKSTSIKSTSIKSTSIYTKDFLEWYSIYPNPWNKQQSFKNFAKLLKTESFANIMLATKNYIAYLKQTGRTDKTYVVRSTNFLGIKKEYLGYLEMDLEDKQDKGNKKNKTANAGAYKLI
ncbi:helix-turn-helix domain-containing protein [Clostridium tyrobutyricum]|uniref:helix-turn-helix domain-containing protein n=1 Tax=Clostridium tyrobutyricum TaxID=1519 RepID=UPI001C37F954|nr:helix-turn-helix domain-containing protein [Clostridium tyrobutyricum]MBV4417168.1 helix-turn-helix domain-containing protein [Clostridium tyrobutyricum]